MQPGPQDGGILKTDVIGTVQWGLFDGTVDLAIATVQSPTANNILLDQIKKGPKTYQTISGTAVPTININVSGSGWQTNLWTGTVTSVNATMIARLADGSSKVFLNQIQLTTNQALVPGDSGTVLTDARNRVIGMVFAGTGTTAFANRIDLIFEAIDDAVLHGKL
jgi:hypothetical protein